MTASARVFVCSSDRASRDRLVRLFREAKFAVSAASSGKKALKAAAADPPSLVIVDFQLGDMWGYELCHQLRGRFGESIAIVLLSEERTEPYDRVAGLLIGADEYFAKPFDPSELVAQVRRLLARDPPPEDELNSQLTPRELEVLRLLARGLPTERVAQMLFISRRTVDTYVQRILTKFRVHSRAEAVALAYRSGLVSPDETPENNDEG